MNRRWLLWLALGSVASAACCVARDGLHVSSRDTPRAPGPTRLWTFEPAERGAILASPLVVGERIYVPLIRDGHPTSGAVYCLDRQTGKPIWRFHDGGRMQQTFSSPWLANGRLYVGDGMHQDFHGKLYCLDAGTGRKYWDFATAGHVESSPCVQDGKVFFGAGDDGIYALDVATGRQVWHQASGLHVDTSPAVVGHRLYAGSGTSVACTKTEVFALDTLDGHIIWHEATKLPVWGSPTLDQGQVFYGLGNGRLLEHPERPAGAVICVDSFNGRRLWTWNGSESVFDRPIVDQDHVYFGARDGLCYCLDRTNGHLKWRADVGSAVVASPRFWKGRLYAVGSAGQLCRLRADNGQVEWRWHLGGDAYSKVRAISTPAVAVDHSGGRVCVYVGVELISPAGSLAQFYALRD
jgi:eukaryotic-like serine/threonine-protein kinase